MEHFKIPKNLQKPEFRFVKLGDWDKWKHQKTKKTQEFYEIVDNFKPDLIIVDCLQRVCSFDIDKENALISSLFTGEYQMNTITLNLPEIEKERLLFLTSKIIISREDLVEIGSIISMALRRKL